MLNSIATFINLVANLFIILVIADSLLSFFLSPYHPVRETMDRLVNPFLAPIQRKVPLVGMLDLSPLILIILIEILARVIISLLRAL